MNESNTPETNPNNSVTPDPIIPETVGFDQAEQKEKSSAKQSEHLNTGLEPDTDWIVKCLIIWLIPIFGGLIFYNDPNPMLKLNARRSISGSRNYDFSCTCKLLFHKLCGLVDIVNNCYIKHER